ncbi:hypothetical protein G7047_02795 [Diaphorobacter sp. HDW4A]|uniref:hypothetical protein n=1 Tax=Diaphorobacter sp. HDW4A TaxID=2714924 RepID=UPI00140B361C|nr:hypothetical protein [Diaphorobacter sp. HDW4A]QIL78967.1 hypothetical protein G7047_02795 [Diaphorobacter sp. HDW4A]
MGTRRPPTCPLCQGPGIALGSLGRLHWYRCRHCGMDFSRAARPKKPHTPAVQPARPTIQEHQA